MWNVVVAFKNNVARRVRDMRGVILGLFFGGLGLVFFLLTCPWVFFKRFDKAFFFHDFEGFFEQNYWLQMVDVNMQQEWNRRLGHELKSVCF